MLCQNVLLTPYMCFPLYEFFCRWYLPKYQTIRIYCNCRLSNINELLSSECSLIGPSADGKVSFSLMTFSAGASRFLLGCLENDAIFGVSWIRVQKTHKVIGQQKCTAWTFLTKFCPLQWECLLGDNQLLQFIEKEENTQNYSFWSLSRY